MPLKGLQQITQFHSPKLTIIEVPLLQLVVVQAYGEVPSRMYRQGLQIAVATAAEKKLKYWLVNNKKGGIITPADQIWSNEVIAPRIAHETSIRKMAFIEPEDVLSAVILENMMDEAKDIFPFEMQFFGCLDSAISWFRDSTYFYPRP
ncbi:hypothetical protein ACFSRY_15475 [Pontibacter locisalis]|uniref:SpoIIAA-like n=1 Tax=Pontibacter locisalis TaxID=1719035 RepID=A0ABW5INS1_9BACT